MSDSMQERKHLAVDGGLKQEFPGDIPAAKRKNGSRPQSCELLPGIRKRFMRPLLEAERDKGQSFRKVRQHGKAQSGSGAKRRKD